MEATGIVRPMGCEDIGAAAKIEQECFSESWSENLLRSGLENSLDSYLVYQEGKEILGYCVLRVLGDEGELQRIAVLPKAQGRGIARKLMDAMAGLARLKGAREISLEVRESNERAISLYKSYGFEKEAVRRGYYHDPPEAALIMWNRRI